MALSHELHGTGDKIRGILETNKVALGLQNTYFGETSLIPKYPAAVIMPTRLERDLKGTHKFKVVMQFEIVLFVFKMGDPAGREEAILSLIAAVENVLDANRTLDGTVLFTMVSEQNVVDIALGSAVVRGASIVIECLSEELF